jgi:NHL repeat
MPRLLLLVLLSLSACGRSGLFDYGPPRLELSPSILDLGGALPDAEISGELVLTNTGKVPVTGIQLGLSSPTRGLFVLGPAPSRLDWGESARVLVTYKGKLPPLSDAVTVSATSDAAKSLATVLAETIDPCDPVACKPARSVCEGEGRCVQGACVHEAFPGKVCDDGSRCTTQDRCNAAGLCGGDALQCSQPPPQRCVSSSTLAKFPAGMCAAATGLCEYPQVLETCQWGCVNDRCFDPCAGVVCNTPPSGCHKPVGTCRPQLPTGVCSYDLDDGKACDDGDPCTVTDTCGNAVCKGSPMVCKSPPAPRCLDPDNSEVHDPNGQCVAGACVYTRRTDFCGIACLRGQCMASCETQLVAGNGVAGYLEGFGAGARVNDPYSLVVDANGTVFVNDTGNGAVRQIVGQTVSTVPGGSGLDGPHDVALDGSGGLLVGARGRVTRIVNGQQSTVAGNGVGGPAIDGPAATAQFGNEVSVFGASGGEVWVADADNHRIRRITGGQVTTFAGSTQGAWVDGPNLVARFNHPHELILHQGSLYVPDALNHAVRRVNIASQTTTTVVGNATAGSTNGSLAAARLNTPLDMSVDPEGAFYVADTSNHCIRRISPTRVTTFAGICGGQGYSEGAALSARFRDPAGVAVSSTAAFYVSDTGNQRIRRIDCKPVP